MKPLKFDSSRPVSWYLVAEGEQDEEETAERGVAYLVDIHFRQSAAALHNSLHVSNK